MANTFFRFKQFTVHQNLAAMKVTTDACLFGGWAAEEISQEKQPGENVLDIGTGTGLLALMLAQKIHAAVDAIEMEPGAAEQARQNASASPFADRISVIEADVRQYPFEKKYRYILSNPPFYEKDLKNEEATEKNLAHHDEGLLLEELAVIISRQLEENGLFFLLLPARRTAAAYQYFMHGGLHIEKMICVRPGPDHADFRILIRGRKTDASRSMETGDLVIKENEKDYSAAFIELLKDYYLYL